MYVWLAGGGGGLFFLLVIDMILRPGLAALSHSWWKAPLQVLAPLSCALTLRRSFASRSCIAVSSNQHRALACAPSLFLSPYLCAPVQLTTQTLHTDSVCLCLGKNVHFAPRSLARTSVFILLPQKEFFEREHAFNTWYETQP